MRAASGGSASSGGPTAIRKICVPAVAGRAGAGGGSTMAAAAVNSKAGNGRRRQLANRRHLTSRVNVARTRHEAEVVLHCAAHAGPGVAPQQGRKALLREVAGEGAHKAGAQDRHLCNDWQAVNPAGCCCPHVKCGGDQPSAVKRRPDAHRGGAVGRDSAQREADDCDHNRPDGHGAADKRRRLSTLLYSAACHGRYADAAQAAVAGVRHPYLLRCQKRDRV